MLANPVEVLTECLCESAERFYKSCTDVKPSELLRSQLLRDFSLEHRLEYHRHKSPWKRERLVNFPATPFRFHCFEGYYKDNRIGLSYEFFKALLPGFAWHNVGTIKKRRESEEPQPFKQLVNKFAAIPSRVRDERFQLVARARSSHEGSMPSLRGGNATVSKAHCRRAQFQFGSIPNWRGIL